MKCFGEYRWAKMPGHRRVNLCQIFLALILGMAGDSIVLGEELVPGAEDPTLQDYPLAPKYRLGSGDLLKISVWKDESLTDEVTVLPDGFVSFPLVGLIRAEGKTVGQFVDDLKKQLSQYVSNPSVSLVVKETRSHKIYIIGKVNRPGEFLVSHSINVMQALSLAGGLTSFASQSGIKILRTLGDQQVVFPFDYGDVLQGDELEQNITLERWDVVMVP